MTTIRAAGVSLALAALLAGSLGARVGPAAAATDAQTLFVANNQWTSNVDPAVDYGQVGPVIFRNCYDSLIRLKGSSSSAYEGLLATSWSANAAKTVWTFRLRKGVTFHDGTPVDAEAVRFSIARTLSVNQGPSFILGQFMSAKGVTVVDPYTVRFTLNGPAPRLLAALTSQWGNAIVSPAAVRLHTVKNDQAQGWLATHEAGSGPYTISQFVPNTSITLARYDRYWKGWSGAHVNRVVMTNISEEQTRRSLIEKGDIDLTLTFSPRNLAEMQKNPQIKVDLSPGVLQETLVPTVYGPFATAQARQALAYAFDYDAMNQGFLKGFAVQAQGPVAHRVFGHDASLPLYRTDLAKARALFAQAGVKQGTPIVEWYIAGDTLAKQIALITQAQLGQLGFSVKAIEKDSNTYISAQGGSAPLAERPNLWVSNWFPDYSDPVDVIAPLYHSKTGGQGAVNMGLYSNKEVDRLLASAAVTVDPAKQQQQFNRLQRILYIEDPSAVFISDTAYQQVYRASLKGFYSNPSYGNTFDFYPLSK